MKRILILSALLLSCSLPLFSQTDVNSKVLSARADFDKETLKGNILIDVFDCDSDNGPDKGIAVRAVHYEDSNTYDLYLYDRYVGISSDKVLIDPLNQMAFKEALDTIRCKFAEWSAVAKRNHITDFHKEIPLKDKVIVKEYITSSFNPQTSWVVAYFDVNTKGKASVSIYFTHESGREYYSDYDFYSLDKLDHFIYITQPEYVLKVIEQTKIRIGELNKAEKERDDLFK